MSNGSIGEPHERDLRAPSGLQRPTGLQVQIVEPSPLVTERLGGAGGELFEAVKRILADRAILISDRTKLVAANSDPCPEVKP